MTRGTPAHDGTADRLAGGRHQGRAAAMRPPARRLPGPVLLLGACLLWLAACGLGGSESATPTRQAAPANGLGASQTAGLPTGERGSPRSSQSGGPTDPGLAAAAGLAELYGGMVADWEMLFDRVFEAVAEPKWANNPALSSALEASMRSYRQRVDQFPPTPVSERIAQSERRAVDLLAEAHQRTTRLSEAPTANERSQVVRLMVEAANAHLGARDMVVGYLQSVGLSPGAFGF